MKSPLFEHTDLEQKAETTLLANSHCQVYGSLEFADLQYFTLTKWAYNILL